MSNLQTASIDLDSTALTETDAIQSIRSTMSSADYARVDNALSGNSRHIELSKLSGVSKRHIQKVLYGSGVSLTVACKIADAAGVSLDQLRLYIYNNVHRPWPVTVTPATSIPIPAPTSTV